MTGREVFVALALVCAAGCSRASAEEPPIPWKPPVDPAWGDLPQTDEAVRALVKHETAETKLKRFDLADLRTLRPDASRMIAGEAAIASSLDSWMNGDGAKPAYVLFGTLHDSRAQLEAVASIVFRMKAPWGFALEQFHAAGHWHGAPETQNADDADLATLTQGSAPIDDGAMWRVANRQERLDHAAWKFGYLPAMTSLIFQSRGAGVPLFACDMPPELHASITPGGETERTLRELHCARALRSASLAVAPQHGGDAGLTDDDPAPPERFAVLVGANHIEPDGLPRFIASKNGKGARVTTLRVLGGRPHDAEGEEAELASRFIVTDPVLVHGSGPDMLLLPDETWGGPIDRTSEHDNGAPSAVAGLPRRNVTVACDESARFSVGESSVDVGAKPEWLSTRAGHRAFVLVSAGRTYVGAVDVPDLGYAELHFTPKDRSVRIVIHTP